MTPSEMIAMFYVHMAPSFLAVGSFFGFIAILAGGGGVVRVLTDPIIRPISMTFLFLSMNGFQLAMHYLMRNANRNGKRVADFLHQKIWLGNQAWKFKIGLRAVHMFVHYMWLEDALVAMWTSSFLMFIISFSALFCRNIPTQNVADEVIYQSFLAAMDFLLGKNRLWLQAIILSTPAFFAFLSRGLLQGDQLFYRYVLIGYDHAAPPPTTDVVAPSPSLSNASPATTSSTDAVPSPPATTSSTPAAAAEDDVHGVR